MSVIRNRNAKPHRIIGIGMRTGQAREVDKVPAPIGSLQRAREALELEHTRHCLARDENRKTGLRRRITSGNMPGTEGHVPGPGGGDHRTGRRLRRGSPPEMQTQFLLPEGFGSAPGFRRGTQLETACTLAAVHPP